MRACAISVLLGAAGCGGGAFACEQASDCQDGDAAGVCQPEGVCSFPDPACDSGQRFGDHSGSLSGTCVPLPADTSGPGTTTASTSVGTTLADDGEVSIDPTLESVGEVSTDGGSVEEESGPTSLTTTEATTGGDVDPSLLLWFTFENVSPMVIENEGSLGGTAPCVLDACPMQTPGPIGMAATFDGIDDCAVFGYVPELAAPQLTLALWFRRDVFLQGYDGVFTKPVGAGAYNTWRVYLEGQAAMETTLLGVHVGLEDDMGVDVQTELVLGAWTHFAATWDGAALSMWIDGVLVGTMPSMLWQVDEHAVTIGCDDDAPIGITHFVTGMLDDVRFYDRVLDEAEIAELAAMGM